MLKKLTIHITDCNTWVGVVTWAVGIPITGPRLLGDVFGILTALTVTHGLEFIILLTVRVEQVNFNISTYKHEFMMKFGEILRKKQLVLMYINRYK